MHNTIRKRSIISIVLVALGLLSATAIQQRENRLVAKRCNRGIYTTGVIQTGIGPVYRCVSKVQAYGPALPLPN